MKRLIFTVLICLALLVPAYGGMIVELPLKTDLVDKKGSLGTGAFARSSAATYVHDGILYTADGDDTPFSNASVEDETGATEMRGSFFDGQAWFHDAGGLIAAYVGTGNLFIGLSGTEYVYGFLGKVGTGLTLGGELVTDGAFTDTLNWAEVGNATVAAGVGTFPGGVDSLIYQAVAITQYKLYKGTVSINALVGAAIVIEGGGSNTRYFRGDSTGAAQVFYFVEGSAAFNGNLVIRCGAAVSAEIDDLSIEEVTEPAATAVHIYKEHGLLNEGWNAIDTGIDYNAGAAWDFDVYVNLMTSTGSTAEARFEDGWLLIEPEGTNLLPYSEDFSGWNLAQTTLDTGEADPREGTDATGLVSSIVAGGHYVYTIPTIMDNADVTLSVFAKAGDKDWLYLQLNTKADALKYSNFYLSGDGSAETNNTTKESIERLGTTDWYRCSITHNIGAGAGVTRVYIYSGESDNDVSFAGDGTTIDTYIYGAQAEQTLFMTSYIPTNGIPVTRTTEAGSAADNGFSWDLPTHGVLEATLDDAIPPATPTDSQGTLTFDVKWGCDETDIATNVGGITVADTYVGLGYFIGTGFRTYDGATASDVAHPAFSAGDTINYVARWGDVDGEANDLSAGLSDDAGATWTFDLTPGVYDGDFTLGSDLRLSYDNLYPIHIRNIRFYDVAYTQAQIAAGLERNMLLWMIPFEFP